MTFLTLRPAMLAVAIGTIGSAALFGPPHITVKQVTDAASAPPGAVLLIEARHHTELGGVQVTGRAEGLRNGQREQHKLTINNIDTGHYSVSRQWQAGTPWVLVFAVEVGDGVSHGVAEAVVQVNADGRIVSIEHPTAGWNDKTKEPLRYPSREIDATLAKLAAKP